MIKKYDIVISRYKENLDWIENFDDKIYNVKVYNKGGDDIKFKFIKLNNIGREAHTWVHYIINNYHDLPEFVIFLQGDPVDHDKDVFDTIKNHNNQDYIALSDHMVPETINSWYENRVENYGNVLERYPKMKRNSLIASSNLILKEETPNKIVFPAGAQYIINKKFIFDRSLNFYKNILNIFEIDFVLPWHLERLWPTIWKL